MEFNKDKKLAIKTRKTKRSKPETFWLNEKGNVFFALFAGVALVGLLGASIMSTMRGPLTTVVEVNRRVTAETQLRNAAAMIIAESVDENTYTAPIDDDDGDCDLDGRIEPIGYKAGSGPTGGGLIPDVIGSDKRDPWGTDYGYCVWDPGTVIDDSDCDDGPVGLNRLAGTNNTGDYIIAMVAAGPDKSFQTICANDPDPGPMLVKGGDDIVVEFSYAAAATVSEGLWTLDPADVGIAEIDKDLEVDGGATFSGDIDLTTTATAALRLGAASLFLPTQNEATTCSGANVGIIRINTTTVPDTLELCDGTWNPVSTSLWQENGNEIYYNVDNVGIGNTDPTEALDVTGNIQTSGDLLIANGQSLIWPSLTSINSSLGNLTLISDTISTTSADGGSIEVSDGIVITTAAGLDINADTIISGTSTLNGGIRATDGTLEVLSNIDLTGNLDLTGDILLSNAQSLLWDGGAAITTNVAGSDINISSSLNVTDDANIGGDLEIGGDFELDGGTIVDSDGTVNVTGNLDVSGNINAADITATGTIDANDYNVDGNSFVPGTCPAGSFNRWTGTAWTCENDQDGGGGGTGSGTSPKTSSSALRN